MKICVLLSVLFAFGLLKGVHAVIWPCADESDCSSVPTATCLNGNCRCPVGEVFSANFSKCLKASFYGEDCEESVQCSHMPSGAKCNERKCQCDEGYTYIRGRCRLLKALDEDCERDTDCWFGYDRESVECKDRKCACAKEYYKRYDNLCRRVSMGVNQPCVVDQDCSVKDNSLRCEKLQCVSRAKRSSLKDIAIQTSFDYFGLNPVPEGEEHAYKDDDIELTAIYPETDADDKSAKTFDKCSKNGEKCPGLYHSLCVENRCYCQLGYYPDGGLCIAEVGEPAQSENLCQGGQFHSKTKMCLCPRNFFYEANMRGCKKGISFVSSCTSDVQCSPFGAASCRKNEEGKKRCLCESYADKDESKELCIQKEGLRGHCDKNKKCTVPHSVCSEQKVCVCAELFVEKNNQCMAGLGNNCKRNEDCGNENSKCVELPTSKKADSSGGVCKCQDRFVEAKGSCLKQAEEIGDECVDSEQCKPLLGKLGKCIDKNCTCEDHHHLSWGKCEEKKVLGDKCSKSSECFTPDEPKMVECRNSVCHCQLGHPMDAEKQICIKPKKNSSGRPSFLKIITLLLIGSAVLITSAAIKQAYF